MQRYNNICHSDDHMKEESRTPPVYVPEILRFALDDKEICVICGEPNYSSLKASAGSTFAARITGMAVPIKDMMRSSR